MAMRIGRGDFGWGKDETQVLDEKSLWAVLAKSMSRTSLLQTGCISIWWAMNPKRGQVKLASLRESNQATICK